MARSTLHRFFHAHFAPPSYLIAPAAGVAVSPHGIKAVTISKHPDGLHLERFADVRLPAGTIAEGEVIDHEVLLGALREIQQQCNIQAAHVAFPESNLEVFDHARIRVRGIESEAASVPRALFRQGDESAVLIIDLGRTKTTLAFVRNHIPQSVEELPVGGQSLTLAVQKYFGMTEAEAKRVQATQGILPSEGDGAYFAAMFMAASMLRERIARALTSRPEQPERAVLIGSGAGVRGLPEYLEESLRMPVEFGDVFTNFAPRSHWLPPLEHHESLAYGAAIGLALREHTP